MTYGEKHLKTDVEGFMADFASYPPAKEYLKQDYNFFRIVENFLFEREKPKISDDERCILKNLGDRFVVIGRTEDGNLYIYTANQIEIKLSQFKDHLFQFIKKGERYNIKELLEDD